MTERFVELVIERVTKVCRRNGIKEEEFWDWLNVKFKEDNGDLTVGKATFIRENASQLLNEYRELLRG